MLHNTFTTDDLIERLGLMRKYYNVRLFSEGEKTDLREVLVGECDERTLQVLESWVTIFTQESIQPLVVFEALDAVQEDLSGIPSIILYVPVRFTPDQIERFGVWFRNNVQPNMLLTLRIDPRATGGCSFIWNNTFYDFSLRYFMDKERDAIVTTFNKYTHAK